MVRPIWSTLYCVVCRRSLCRQSCVRSRCRAGRERGEISSKAFTPQLSAQIALLTVPSCNPGHQIPVAPGGKKRPGCSHFFYVALLVPTSHTYISYPTPNFSTLQDFLVSWKLWIPAYTSDTSSQPDYSAPRHAEAAVCRVSSFFSARIRDPDPGLAFWFIVTRSDS
ncbi:hypothetical protein EV426DRAFT_154831 [Tirmania nivea]|nr:hypothetical protein EV426DRAFT_154831 [Tirmania nivea]